MPHASTNDDRQKVYWEAGHKFRSYDHPVVEFFAKQRVEQLARRLPLAQIQNALDVGCGDGFSSFYMSRRIPELWAVDRSNRMLRRHPLLGSGRVFSCDAFRLPFRDNSFDLVYCWELLHHVSNPQSVLREMIRVSRKYVVAAEPNRNNPFQFGFALWDREHRWVLRFSLGYMRRLFASAGLQIERAFCGGCIFPNMTPIWLFPLLRRVPYRVPLVGISNWVLAKKP
jgi:ubiquinone/menaquinone biosynthesis C-methylase UbiE